MFIITPGVDEVVLKVTSIVPAFVLAATSSRFSKAPRKNLDTASALFHGSQARVVFIVAIAGCPHPVMLATSAAVAGLNQVIPLIAVLYVAMSAVYVAILAAETAVASVPILMVVSKLVPGGTNAGLLIGVNPASIAAPLMVSRFPCFPSCHSSALVLILVVFILVEVNKDCAALLAYVSPPVNTHRAIALCHPSLRLFALKLLNVCVYCCSRTSLVSV